MKLISALLLTLFTASAFADQTINCYQLNESGSKKANGATLKLQLVITTRGEVAAKGSKITIKNLWEKGSGFGQEFASISGYNSQTIEGKVPFAHINFNDAFDGEMLEYQLQLTDGVFNKDFKNVKATFVYGMEDTGAGYPSFGFDVMCSGKLN